MDDGYDDLSILANPSRLAQASIAELRHQVESLVAVHSALHANWSVTDSERDQRLEAQMLPVTKAMHRIADELDARVPDDIEESVDRIAGLASIEAYAHAGLYLGQIEAWVSGRSHDSVDDV